MAGRCLLCLPPFCLPSSPSSITRVWPERPRAKLWQSRAKSDQGSEDTHSTPRLKSSILEPRRDVNAHFFAPSDSFAGAPDDNGSQTWYMRREWGWQAARSGPGLAESPPILGSATRAGQRPPIMGRSVPGCLHTQPCHIPTSYGPTQTGNCTSCPAESWLLTARRAVLDLRPRYWRPPNTV